MRTLVVMEPGGTHMKDFDRIIRLIGMARDAGADVFKNQWTSSAGRMCARRSAQEYLDSYRLIEFPLVWHYAFREVAHACGLQYACSAYLPEDVATLMDRVGVDFLKVSSFEAADPLMHAALKERPGGKVVISTGMMPRQELRRLSSEVDTTGQPWLLHCVSSYPCALRDLRLGELQEDGDDYQFLGLSDHSRDVRTGGWAVCAGARMVEAHAMLEDTPLRSRDYAVSFRPDEFGQYIRNIRDAEQALGDGTDDRPACEADMLRYRVGG